MIFNTALKETRVKNWRPGTQATLEQTLICCAYIVSSIIDLSERRLTSLCDLLVYEHNVWTPWQLYWVVSLVEFANKLNEIMKNGNVEKENKRFSLLLQKVYLQRYQQEDRKSHLRTLLHPSTKREGLRMSSTFLKLQLV